MKGKTFVTKNLAVWRDGKPLIIVWLGDFKQGVYQPKFLLLRIAKV
jgi:hypothetical protein